MVSGRLLTVSDTEPFFTRTESPISLRRRELVRPETVGGLPASPFLLAASANFAIKTDKPNLEVSWQVTGIRQDAWANAPRIPVEVSKPESERGSYLHPELFGAPGEKSIAAVRHPMMQKMLKEKVALCQPLPHIAACPTLQGIERWGTCICGFIKLPERQLPLLFLPRGSSPWQRQSRVTWMYRRQRAKSHSHPSSPVIQLEST